MSRLAEHAAAEHREASPRNGDADRSHVRWFAYAAIIAAFAGASLAAILNVQPLLSANDRSRWCTVWSLAERGTYQIDEIIAYRGWDTIDKVRHEEHFYSSKPPLLPTLVAGLYWIVKQTTGRTLLVDTAYVTRLILVIVNLVPMVIALAVLARFVERYATMDRTRYFVLLTGAFGTFLTTFLVTFNNHTVAAVAVMCALYPAARILADKSRCPGLFAIAGFFAAFACTNELPAALFGLLLFLLLLHDAPRQSLLFFASAAVVPLAAYFVTVVLQTGGWKPFYAFYGTEKYNYEIEGVPSYWSHPTGIDAGGDDPLTYFLHCTVGHHGIFSLSPVFLLTVAAWVRWRGWRDASIRLLLWLGLVLTAATLGFYLTRTQNYNYGGFSSGLRWTFWLIPFWLIGMIPLLDRDATRTRWFATLAAGLLVVSTFSAWYPINNPWRHPWIFQIGESLGWIDYSTPPPVLDPPATTWFRSLPSGDAGGERQWIELTSAEADGSTTRLRLEDAGSPSGADGAQRKIAARWNPGTTHERVETFTIDVASFKAGEDASRFLEWPGGPPSPETRREAEVFVHGLPLPREYRASRDRYLHTALRTTAFRCVLAEAQVDYRPEGQPRELRYRSDVWYCDEVPFGVLRVIATVSDPRTGAMHSRRDWQAVAASGGEARD